MTLPGRLLARLRIRTRLGLAFALLLGALLGLAALSVSRLTSLSATLNNVVDEQAVIRDAVNEINRSAEAAARKLLVLMSPEAEARILAYTEIDTANRRLDDAMRRLAQILPPGPRMERHTELQQRLADYRASYILAADLIEADDFQGARAQLGGDTEGALSLFVGAIHQLSSSEERAAVAQARELRDQIDTDRGGVLALCLTALALGAITAVGVTRSITRPLQRAEDGALRIAEGHYDHRINASGGGEIARVVAAVNTMAAAIVEREAEKQRRADTDSLTGLALRGRFVRDGDALLTSLRAEGASHALLICIDVDRLKDVNSVFGFDAGDALLCAAAARLGALFGGAAVFSRMAGGTFATLAPLLRPDQARALVNSLRAGLEHKVLWQGNPLDLAVSIGYAHWPEHEADTERLLRRAELAMYEAKRLGLSDLAFNPSTEAAREQDLSLLSELQEAISQGQLRQFLQPKRDLATGQIVGAEALIRWQHPLRGWLPPSEFVPFAERSGRINLITDWMLERAVQTLARWKAEQRAPIYIAVNISTLDIRDNSLPSRVSGLLQKYGVDAPQLQLEVTEGRLMDSGLNPIDVLKALKAWGVRLAIDDFGTGQSSLAYLQNLPVDELKIDRSFVQDVHTEKRREALLESIVNVGRGLGLTVTAEGVEDEAELASVRASGCNLVQGYLLAKPMDAPDFEAWLSGQG